MEPLSAVLGCGLPESIQNYVLVAMGVGMMAIGVLGLMNKGPLAKPAESRVEE